MFIPFEKISDLSRTWIYQADKKLNAAQKKLIGETLEAFTDRWLVHGASIDASFDIQYDHFIVLVANDNTSGCSIDDSVRTIKALGDRLDVDFFNRSLVAFKKNNQVELIPIAALQMKYNEGYWDAETLMFNNLITTKEDLTNKWIIPANNAWIKRYLPKETLTH